METLSEEKFIANELLRVNRDIEGSILEERRKEDLMREDSVDER